MILQIAGVIIGMFWGWPFAIVGFGVGALLSAALSSDHSGSGEYSDNLFNQNDDRSYGCTDDLFDHNGTGITGISDSVSSFDSVDNPGCNVNPANGLPMVGGIGGIDVEGNPYGTDCSHDDHFSDFNSGGGFGSGFNDNW